MSYLVLQTGLTPSASGSAYLELELLSGKSSGAQNLSNPPSSLKLTCAVHGPRPLPRSAPFTPQLLLSTHVKFAPFASRQRRGYVRDVSERDLAVHLETALRGVLISERWPKSGVDVVVTVLEGEEEPQPYEKGAEGGSEPFQSQGWAMMSILSGCITVSSAAVMDAGIDCVDIVTGGVAAIICQPTGSKIAGKSRACSGQIEIPNHIVDDPCFTEHDSVMAACVVGYLQSRDEVTIIWMKGSAQNNENRNPDYTTSHDAMIDRAVKAAMTARLVVSDIITESTKTNIKNSISDGT